MNPDNNRHLPPGMPNGPLPNGVVPNGVLPTGALFAPADLRAIDLPLEPSATPAMTLGLIPRSTRPPPAPVYTPRRRSLQSALISHPDDNPGPWTRRSASWSRAEDERLAQLVRMEEAACPTSTPTKMWSRVAAQLTSRTGKQCRERWLNQLKPGIRRGSWTEEEERILHAAHAELGNKWVAIATRLPGRTDNCVKNHWNSMLRKRQRREAALRTTFRAPASSPGPSPGGPVNPGLARQVSAIADSRPQNPAAVMYAGLRAANPGLYGEMTGSLMELPGLSSPITPARNAKLRIANLVGPAHPAASFRGPAVGEKRPAPPLDYAAGGKRRSVLYPSGQLHSTPVRAASSNRTLTHPTFNYPHNVVDHNATHNAAVGASIGHGVGHGVSPTINYNAGRASLTPTSASARIDNIPHLYAPVAYTGDENTVPVYPYQHGQCSLSPVSTSVVSAPYAPLDQRLWAAGAYGHVDQQNRFPTLAPHLSMPMHPTLPLQASLPMQASPLQASLQTTLGLPVRPGTAEGSDMTKSLDATVSEGRSTQELPVDLPVLPKQETVPALPSKTVSRPKLYAAGGSLPPSPLTPESHFSSTSLSSDTSPPPRTVPRAGSPAAAPAAPQNAAVAVDPRAGGVQASAGMPPHARGHAN